MYEKLEPDSKPNITELYAVTETPDMSVDIARRTPLKHPRQREGLIVLD